MTAARDRDEHEHGSGRRDAGHRVEVVEAGDDVWHASPAARPPAVGSALDNGTHAVAATVGLVDGFQVACARSVRTGS